MKKAMVKRIIAVGLAAMMTLALAACGSSGGSSSGGGEEAASGDKKIIKISYGLVKESGEGTGASKFEELVEAKLGDKFDVQCYSDAQLGDDLKSTQAVSVGELECVITSCSPLTGMCSDLLVFDLPFLFPNTEAADAVMDGEIGDSIAAKIEPNGLHVLGWMENGYRCLTNSKKDVHVPADVAGMKIRTMENELHLAAWKELGAVPTPMAFSEVFTALEQGAIDGQENPISTIYLNKFYEPNPYVTVSNHIYSPKLFLISADLYNGLTDEEKAVFDEAGKEASKVARETNRQQCADYVTSIRDEGATVTELTDEEHQQWVDATAGVKDMFKDQIGEDLIKAVEDVCANY